MDVQFRVLQAQSGRPVPDWDGSAGKSESTFHQLAPYIGKTKSSMANALVRRYSRAGDLICDPFSGCGTFAFEAWAANRSVLTTDLSPYATLLTRAKLFPYPTHAVALKDFIKLSGIAESRESEVDLRKIPMWVRQFFHPETLREVVAWSTTLVEYKRWFLLSCLLGILHHQRPGFLSYPSSHTVPYLRVKNFPRDKFPELYEYRAVKDRLEAKLARAFRRVPKLDLSLSRNCKTVSAARISSATPVDTILTSPPYMRQLDYGRDNRLRLWFLGCDDARALDKTVSPSKDDFLSLMENCFGAWRDFLKPGGHCVLVIGNEVRRNGERQLAHDVAEIAADIVGGYSVVGIHSEPIPNDRRVRRGLAGSTSETVLVLKTTKRRT